MVYPFAALIIFAAIRLVWGNQKQREMVVAACAICSTWVARLIPITPVYHRGKFVVRQPEQGNRLVATPLLVALIIVETSDIVFALDSVPAVLAVTREPFLVYTSNVFAILGLRCSTFSGGIASAFTPSLRLAVILIFFEQAPLASDRGPESHLSGPDRRGAGTFRDCVDQMAGPAACLTVGSAP